MKKNYLFLSILFSSILPIFASAQLTIVPGVTAAVLASKLIGPGVIMINPVLTCDTNAYGTFSGFSTLSFDSGIVLTNGQAKTTPFATGCNSSAVTSFASNGNGSPGDPQLTALAGQPTFDACILQFDFRPAGDTVKFDYVFGSEEYGGFTCSDYNDVFGFFISGPGYATPKNIALVPGTNIPVCINSVNCGPSLGYSISTCNAVGPGSPFCAYYVNNSAGTTIVYTGLTATLTAIASVTPCDTYHLKIGVADASDDVLDSGVFLKAGSLTSTGIHVLSSGINPADTGFAAQYCVRGCTPGKFIFGRTGNLSDTFTIHYIIAGTAVNGFDYSTIADSVVIPINDSTDTVFIHGLVIPPSGPQTVKLLILAPYTCGGLPVIIDSAELTIYDSLYVHINTADTGICIGQHVNISTSGSPVLSYLWSPSTSLNSSTLLNPTATPPGSTTYTVTATLPGAGCAPSHDMITIDVFQPPVLDAGPPVQSICVGSPLQLGVTATPSAPYTYSWTPVTYLDNAAIANPVVTPGVIADAEYYVTVSPTSVVGCSTTDSFLLHVLPNDFNLYNPDTGICYPPATYQVRSSGDSEFSYQWSPTYGVSSPNSIAPVLSPQGTTTYLLTAKYPGCPDMVHSVKYSIENPQVNIITSDTTFCSGLPVPIPVLVTPADSPYILTWTPGTNLSDSTIIETNFTGTIPGPYTYHLLIQSGLGCTSTDSVTMNVAPPIHIGATPASTVIKYGSHLQMNAVNMTTYKLFYYWTPNDGTLDDPNVNNPVATPLTPTVYVAHAMNEWGCSDTASVAVSIDYTSNDCLPSAFTPNGDGLNDIFRLCNLHDQRLVDFSVFNRWGQLVYRNTSDPTKGWDGTFNGAPAEVGVYNYMAIIAQPDGTNKTYTGDVTLMR